MIWERLHRIFLPAISKQKVFPYLQFSHLGLCLPQNKRRTSGVPGTPGEGAAMWQGHKLRRTPRACRGERRIFGAIANPKPISSSFYKR